MSNAVFPTLPGVDMEVTRAPEFKTFIRETASGREYRGRTMLYPRYERILRFNVLGDSGAWYDGYRTLLGFFNARGGSFDSFLLDDEDDNSVTAQIIGTGDGTTTAFQLLRTLGGFAEPIYDTKVAPSIYDNGTLRTAVTHYSISAGLVTFVTPPAVGHVITWTGTYYWRARFKEDRLEFTRFMRQLWELRTCTLKTVKP